MRFHRGNRSLIAVLISGLLSFAPGSVGTQAFAATLSKANGEGGRPPAIRRPPVITLHLSAPTAFEYADRPHDGSLRDISLDILRPIYPVRAVSGLEQNSLPVRINGNLIPVSAADSNDYHDAKVAGLLTRARVGWSILVGERRDDAEFSAAPNPITKKDASLLSAKPFLSWPVSVVVADTTATPEMLAHSSGYWSEHGVFIGTGILALSVLFPRVMLAGAVILTGSIGVNILGAIGWLIAPRIVIATIVSNAYWGQNPWLIAGAWILALLDLMPDRNSEEDLQTRMAMDRRTKALRRLYDDLNPIPLHPNPTADSEKSRPMMLALIIGVLLFIPISLRAGGVNPLPEEPLRKLLQMNQLWPMTLWTVGLSVGAIALAFLSHHYNPSIMKGQNTPEVEDIADGFFTSISAAVIEEFVFRKLLYGGMYATLTSVFGFNFAWGFIVAALISSYIFSIIHGYGSLWARVTGGVLFCGIFFVTGSIVWPMFVHFLYDFILFSWFVIERDQAGSAARQE